MSMDRHSAVMHLFVMWDNSMMPMLPSNQMITVINWLFAEIENFIEITWKMKKTRLAMHIHHIRSPSIVVWSQFFPFFCSENFFNTISTPINVSQTTQITFNCRPATESNRPTAIRLNQDPWRCYQRDKVTFTTFSLSLERCDFVTSFLNFFNQKYADSLLCFQKKKEKIDKAITVYAIFT